MKTDLYLRDLNEGCKESVMRKIAKVRPDLVKAIEDGEDVVIGYYIHEQDYEVIG